MPKDTQSVVQNGLAKENIDLRPTAGVHSDQKACDGADPPKLYSPHAPIKSAAASNYDAPQSKLTLRHEIKEQQDSASVSMERLGLPKLGRKQRQLKKLRYREAIQAKKQKDKDEMLAATKEGENLEMRDAL